MVQTVGLEAGTGFERAQTITDLKRWSVVWAKPSGALFQTY